MNYLSVVLIVMATVMSCHQRDVTGESQVSFYIDNQKEESLIRSAIASVTCNNLYINNIDFSNTAPLYSLEINLLKNGKIVNIKLINKEKKRYETQLFDPARYVLISNFKYDSLAKQVSFNIDGKLYIPQSVNSIDISGEFKKLAIESNTCTITENRLQGITQSQSTSLQTETIFSSTAKEGNIYYQYFYLTDNFRLVFKSSTGFKTIPTGTYPLTSNSTSPFNISFQEYTGLSTPNNFNLYKENEWRNFNLEGSVIIQKHLTIQDKPFTMGTLQFQATNQAENRRYEFKNGSFIFLNLE